MKSKYVMIGGLAFSEESDMEKLEDYAREGWILEGIIGGVFYKLKKAEPQDIIYSLDYQTEASEEYFTIFKEAGWKHILSVNNQMHIFSAQAGTKPIYSDSKTEIDKYTSIRNQTRRGTIFSSIIAIVLIGLLVISAIAIRPIFLIVLILLVIDIVIFVFNFMPYLAYNSRIKQIKRDGRCKNTVVNNKTTGKLYALAGVMFLVLGILHLIEKKYSAVISISLGVLNIVLSLNYYKKCKKS